MTLDGPSALAVLVPKKSLQGCMDWRVYKPFGYLQRAGYPARWTTVLDPMLDERSAAADVVILPKLGFIAQHREAALRWRDAIHDAGGTLVYEADDDVFTEALEYLLGALSRATSEETAAQREAYVWTLRLCDGATVTGPRLAEAARRYTDKPVEVVPNALDWEWFKGVQRGAPRLVDGLTIGWMGGGRSERDLDDMATAWGRIARRYPRVRFVVQGWRPKVIAEAVPEDRLTILPWMEVAEYPRGLVNVDIGCCPLPDTPFNRSKSYIKALEWAVSGAAVVASPTLYSADPAESTGLVGPIADGEDGYIARTVDEWEGYLSRLVESKRRRRDFARALGEKVRARFSMEASVHRWPEAWRRIRAAHRATRENKETRERECVASR